MQADTPKKPKSPPTLVAIADERDLQWIAWFCYVEPRAAKYLRERRPNSPVSCANVRGNSKSRLQLARSKIEAMFSTPSLGQ
jgi:hypothetical protein